MTDENYSKGRFSSCSKLISVLESCRYTQEDIEHLANLISIMRTRDVTPDELIIYLDAGLISLVEEINDYLRNVNEKLD